MAYGRRQPGPSVCHITQTSVPATRLGETPLQCAAPTNQPSTCLPELEEKAREPPQVTMPPTPPEKAKEVVKAVKTEEVAALVNPVWIQVHPSRPVVPVGIVPHSLGDEQHCHHSHSCHSCKRASL